MTAVRGPRKQPAPQPAPPPPPAAKKVNAKLVAGVAVVVLAAAYLLTRGGANEPATAPTSNAGAIAESAVHDAPVVPLDSITVNLADGKFLRLGIALQLGESEEEAEGSDPKTFGARALDSAIDIMSAYTSGELATAEGRAAARKALSKAVIDRYVGEVVGIYITDFVTQ